MDGPDDSGRFQTKQVLDAGTHEYKFVLEGTRWRHPAKRRETDAGWSLIGYLNGLRTRC